MQITGNSSYYSMTQRPLTETSSSRENTDETKVAGATASAPAGQDEKTTDKTISISEDTKADGTALSSDEQRELDALKARDTEVRTHEQAHLSAAGDLAVSGANFTFTTGPDSQKYAVGGEVSIDTSEAEDPQSTITKMQRVRQAALAPAQPSAQDIKVAAEATATAASAQAELRESDGSSEEKEDTVETDTSTSAAQSDAHRQAADAYSAMSELASEPVQALQFAV
jgi:hypothetical protein